MKPHGLPITLVVALATCGSDPYAVAGGGMHVSYQRAPYRPVTRVIARFRGGGTSYASGHQAGAHLSIGHRPGDAQIGGWHTATGYGLAPEPVFNHGSYGYGSYGQVSGSIRPGTWHTWTGRGLTPIRYQPSYGYRHKGYQPFRDRVWTGNRYSYGPGMYQAYGAAYGYGSGIEETYDDEPADSYASGGSQASGYAPPYGSGGYPTSSEAAPEGDYGPDSCQIPGYGRSVRPVATEYGWRYGHYPHGFNRDRFDRDRLYTEHDERRWDRDHHHAYGDGWAYGGGAFHVHRRERGAFYGSHQHYDRITVDHRFSADRRGPYPGPYGAPGG